jgi:hypothetical protein
MSSINDVNLDLRKSTRVCRGGETLNGQIRVDVEEHCECRRVEVAAYWYTTGMGSQDKGSSNKRRLYSGDFERRRNYDYDFELDLPSGPYTYDGELVSVRWVVEAKVDVYGEPLHKSQREIRLDPGPEDDYDPGGSIGGINHYNPGARYEGMSKATGSIDRGAKLAIPLFLGGIGMLFFLFIKNLFTWTQSGGGLGLNIIWFAMGLVMTFLGGGVLYSVSKDFLNNDDDPIRRINMNLSPNELSPGDSATGELQIYAKRGLQIENIEATCRGYERIIEPKTVEKAAVGEAVKKKIKHEEIIEPDEMSPDKIRGGEAATYDLDFEVPDSAPFSFYGRDNQILWELETVISLKGAQNVVQLVPFTVRPARKT